MNKWLLKAVCFGFIALNGISTGKCQDIPNELVEYHKKVDHWASSKTFRWTSQVIDKLYKVTFSNSRQKGDRSQAKSSPRISRYNIHSDIIRNGDQTLLKGSLPIFSNSSQTERSIEGNRTRIYTVFYDKDRALFHDYADSSDQAGVDSPTPSSLPPAIAWKCPDSCLNYAHPKEVLIRPEKFVFLSCKNPLNVLGCQWKRLSENSEQVVFECFDAPGNPSSRARATFSKKHSGAVMRFEIFSGVKETKIPSVLWETRQFRRDGKYWIPAEVYTIIRVGIKNPISVTEYKWKLEKIDTTSQTDLNIPKGKEVNDYRLVSSLFTNELMWKHMNDGVSYNWQGSLPSEAELRRMALEQGKFPPSPRGARASWVLLIPAFILLGLAAYFYKTMQKRAV